MYIETNQPLNVSSIHASSRHKSPCVKAKYNTSLINTYKKKKNTSLRRESKLRHGIQTHSLTLCMLCLMMSKTMLTIFLD